MPRSLLRPSSPRRALRLLTAAAASIAVSPRRSREKEVVRKLWCDAMTAQLQVCSPHQLCRWLWLTPYFSPFAYRMTWCVASIKFSFFLAVHPSCMDYSEKLIKKIVQLSTWQCTNCKTCQVCHEANDDVRDKFRCMHYADLDVL